MRSGKSQYGDLPAIDDHFIVEDSCVEVVDGILYMAPPADEPHATIHLTLASVLAAHLGPDWVGALDMLTRTSQDSAFAPDASVFPRERDPVTGGRRIEALAFEIADTEPLPLAEKKARQLIGRGIRRVFCVVVRHRRLLEWSSETDGWSPLPDDAVLDDPCFIRPLPVRALVDAKAATEAVVAALDSRGEPALRTIEARGEARGEAKGRAAALLTVLEARGLRATRRQRSEIGAATVEQLDRWLARSPVARSVADLLAGD